ncbi:NAD(P)/FAD-dependent oxidoreductase [Pseudomonas sp. R5(2019)]|uniref:flavin-dependent monooxygenase QhpG n=1 Tax=Pseudomonas sp. R5(2019) TaxID=2697566 RepID=UPI0014134111|nr:FAD-dependent monooxygenase [Pseudomonas sp. R5(2019)]NBA94981.1 FAD-dependent oxidoreductase [Pseudomonas sp. R5(2019)]
MTQIVVLGAGPAGATVAIGLRRLGYRVVVVSEWRRFAALEGVSRRVLEGLQAAGLHRAMATAAAPIQRRVHWNGEQPAPNVEFLLDRPRFDQGLREDVRGAGVELIEGRVLNVSEQWVEIDGAEPVRADFIVEARGRQAPQNSRTGKARRGPETLSLLNRWQGVPGGPASAIESLPDGWAWMARHADGSCYWQLTVDVASAQLPEKNQLLEFCRQRRRQSALVHDLFGDTEETGLELHARSSTAILAQPVCGERWLRVGDAAMAVDPLSGNGIFQSLSSALQAPAVINTLLQKPERAALARQFHQQRVEQLFWRFARTGRDFYALEQQWGEQPFWQARSHWPDAQVAHAAPDFSALKVVKAPVLRDGWIDAAQVVITPDQPLGIWHLQGVELAPLVQRLKREPAQQVLAHLNLEQQRNVRSWLLSQGYRP